MLKEYNIKKYVRPFLLLLALSFIGKNCDALTLADAETETRRLVKDTASSSSLQRYSDTILTAFLNQSQREVVTDTWCLQKSTGMTLVAGTSYYNLPSDLIAVRLVSFKDSNSRKRDLTETSYKAVRQNNPDYERQTGPPTQYAIRNSTQSTTLEICFMPFATSASTGVITVDYFNQSTDLSSGSTVFLDGELQLVPYHETIVYKTVARIKMIEGDATGAQFYLQLYSASVNAMNSRLGERPNLNPGISGAITGR